MIEASRTAAIELLTRFDPDKYKQSRNHLDGEVSRISAYLTHGFLSLSEVFEFVQPRYLLPFDHKFIFELGWRDYYRHVWGCIGNGIHRSLHEGPLPDHEYDSRVPGDVRSATTGIPVIDQAVRQLYATGYLHNHARLWLASYLVHFRKVHWHAGAQWMIGHLIDGDLASNHLSWQWVSGNGSVKPYLFNAENVAKFADSDWHSFDTALDTSYEFLREIAFQKQPAQGSSPPRPVRDGVQEPALEPCPRDSHWESPDPNIAIGREVLLVHPWALGSATIEQTTNIVRIGVGFTECHAQMPWSQTRWDFVTSAMIENTEHLWWGDVHTVGNALANARSVRWQRDPHVDGPFNVLTSMINSGYPAPLISSYAQPALFSEVPTFCASFAQWWRKTRLLPKAGDEMRERLMET